MATRDLTSPVAADQLAAGAFFWESGRGIFSKLNVGPASGAAAWAIQQTRNGNMLTTIITAAFNTWRVYFI